MRPERVPNPPYRRHTIREKRLRRALNDALDAVPTNWCDPLLTGSDAVFVRGEAEASVEAVLRGVKARVRRIITVALKECE